MTVDCMACLVRLARGCPTAGRARVENGVTCAAVLTASILNPTYRFDLPAHSFTFSKYAGRWLTFERAVARWAVRDQA